MLPTMQDPFAYALVFGSLRSPYGPGVPSPRCRRPSGPVRPAGSVPAAEPSRSAESLCPFGAVRAVEPIRRAGFPPLVEPPWSVEPVRPGQESGGGGVSAVGP